MRGEKLFGALAVALLSLQALAGDHPPRPIFKAKAVASGPLYLNRTSQPDLSTQSSSILPESTPAQKADRPIASDSSSVETPTFIGIVPTNATVISSSSSSSSSASPDIPPISQSSLITPTISSYPNGSNITSPPGPVCTGCIIGIWEPTLVSFTGMRELREVVIQITATVLPLVSIGADNQSTTFDFSTVTETIVANATSTADYTGLPTYDLTWTTNGVTLTYPTTYVQYPNIRGAVSSAAPAGPSDAYSRCTAEVSRIDIDTYADPNLYVPLTEGFDKDNPIPTTVPPELVSYLDTIPTVVEQLSGLRPTDCRRSSFDPTETLNPTFGAPPQTQPATTVFTGFFPPALQVTTIAELTTVAGPPILVQAPIGGGNIKPTDVSTEQPTAGPSNPATGPGIVPPSGPTNTPVNPPDRIVSPTQQPPNQPPNQPSPTQNPPNPPTTPATQQPPGQPQNTQQPSNQVQPQTQNQPQQPNPTQAPPNLISIIQNLGTLQPTQLQQGNPQNPQPGQPQNTQANPPGQPQNTQGSPPFQPQNTQGNPLTQPQNTQGNPPIQPQNTQGNPPAQPQNTQGNPPTQPQVTQGVVQPGQPQQQPAPTTVTINSTPFVIAPVPVPTSPRGQPQGPQPTPGAPNNPPNPPNPQQTPPGIVIGTQTVLPGVSTTINGVPVFLGPSGSTLQIGSSTLVNPFSPSNPSPAPAVVAPVVAPILTVGTNTITAQPGPTGPVFVIAPGTTLSPGGPAVTVSGQTLSLPNQNTGPITAAPAPFTFPTPTLTGPAVLTIAPGTTITAQPVQATGGPDAGPAFIIAPGTTLSAGGPAVTISGTTFSVPSSSPAQVTGGSGAPPAVVVVNGQSSTLVPAPLALPTGTAGGTTVVGGFTTTLPNGQTSVIGGTTVAVASGITTIVAPTGTTILNGPSNPATIISSAGPGSPATTVVIPAASPSGSATPQPPVTVIVGSGPTATTTLVFSNGVTFVITPSGTSVVSGSTDAGSSTKPVVVVINGTTSTLGMVTVPATASGSGSLTRSTRTGTATTSGPGDFITSGLGGPNAVGSSISAAGASRVARNSVEGWMERVLLSLLGVVALL